MMRLATESDIPAVALLARNVAYDLHRLGIDQWSDVYPLAVHFEADLARNGLYVYERNGRIEGACAILPEADPPYRTIPFQTGEAIVLHRVMVEPSVMRGGIGTTMFAFAERLAKERSIPWIRVDTHPDNFRMRNFLIKEGFQEVGYMPSIHRIGYEKQPR
jgi:GNAT superfamily N-acetyltransferase